jgi:hypothetical protein
MEELGSPLIEDRVTRKPKLRPVDANGGKAS